MKNVATVQDYQELADFLVKQFAFVHQKFDVIDKRFDDVDKKFDKIDKRFEGIDKRFDTLEKRFDILEGRFDSLEVRFGSLESRVGVVEGTIAALPTREYVDRKFAETHDLILKGSLRIDVLVDVLHTKKVINDNDKKLVNRYKSI